MGLFTKFVVIFIACLLFSLPGKLEAFGSSSNLEDILCRKNEWPAWFLPGPYDGSFMSDLFYPIWLKGLWEVESKDVDSSEIINYPVRFIENQDNKIIADRLFNTSSIGKKIFGEQFLSVKNDPNSANRQLALFKNNVYIETKVIARLQHEINDNSLITDELALQIIHGIDVSRITQVETMTLFNHCPNSPFLISDMVNIDEVCAEQWQAVYKGPGESIHQVPIKVNHFSLYLKSLEN